jgi:hypothetical protein
MKKLILLLILIYSTSYSQFNWQKLEGPYGGPSAAMNNQGDSIIVDVGGTLFYSTNAGISWTQTNLTVKGYFISILFADNFTFLASDGSSIYKSSNMADWEIIVAGNFNEFKKDKKGNLYAIYGEYSRNVYRSTNHGYSWHNYFTIPNSFFPRLLVTNNYLFVTGKEVVHRLLLDQNHSAVSIAVPLFKNSTFLSMDSDSVIFGAFDYYKSFAVSSDFGNTWNQINLDSIPGISPRRIFATDNILFLSNENKNLPPLYKSSNKGHSWESASDGIPLNNYISNVVQTPKGFLASTSKGLISSRDASYWFRSSLGISQVNFDKLILADDGSLIASTWDLGIIKSTDHGFSWNEKNGGMSEITTGSLVKAENGFLFVSSNQGIFKSFDHAESWRRVPNPESFNNYYNLFIGPNDQLFAWRPGQKKLYISNDYGISWQIFFNENVDIKGLAFSSAGNIFITTLNAKRIYKSSNNGSTWSIIFNYTTFFQEPLIDQSGNIFIPSNNGLFKSTNEGVSWGINTNDFVNPYLKRIYTDYNGNFFCSSRFSWGVLPELYHSSDEGNSWQVVTNGLFNAVVDDILFYSNKIFLATNKGIWIHTHARVLSNNEQSLLTEFSVSQNFPNPFNPVTKIKFVIPTSPPSPFLTNERGAAFVTLKIYDILGNEVATLVNEVKEPGEYEVEWLASNFTSGVYFYSIHANSEDGKQNYMSTRKMILMK